MPSKYLIYGLVDPRDRQLRYVGKSCSGLRRARQHTTPSSLKADTHKTRWLKSLLLTDRSPDVVILFECDESLLSMAEIFWIKYFRQAGHPLTNTALGGEGGATCIGRSLSADRKAHLSVIRLGTKMPDEVKARIAAAARGRQHSDATKQKLVASSTGNKNGRFHKGWVMPEETKKKLSAARKALFASRREQKDAAQR